MAASKHPDHRPRPACGDYLAETGLHRTFEFFNLTEELPTMAKGEIGRSKLGRLFTTLSAAGLIVALTSGAGTARAETPSKPLSANDVSILFPPPKAPADLVNLIAASDLSGPTRAPQRLFSDEDFARFIANAENPERGGVPESGVRRIQLPDVVKKIDAWFVAGIRIDPGAPGLSADVIAQFGRQPQIRLIIQPVTNDPQGFKVHDTAGHLIFSFNLEPDPSLDGCAPFPRFKPDEGNRS